MSRIPTPATIEAAPADAQPMLNAVKKSFGSVPNFYRVVANSPVALEGYLGLDGALEKGELDVATREGIAIALANFNGCNYCNSAHSYMGKTMFKTSETEIVANRAGSSGNAKIAAAIKFALAVTRERGRVNETDWNAVRDAGFTDSQLVEIVAHVALNTLTNYMNGVFKTDVDFPFVEAQRAS